MQKDNRLLLQRLMEIDRNPSELNKKRTKPKCFRIRSSSASKASNHPQALLNSKSRTEELTKISHENFLLVNKLKETKASIDITRIKSESRQLVNLTKSLSHNKILKIKLKNKKSDHMLKAFRELINSKRNTSAKERKLTLTDILAN